MKITAEMIKLMVDIYREKSAFGNTHSLEDIFKTTLEAVFEHIGTPEEKEDGVCKCTMWMGTRYDISETNFPRCINCKKLNLHWEIIRKIEENKKFCEGENCTTNTEGTPHSRKYLFEQIGAYDKEKIVKKICPDCKVDLNQDVCECSLKPTKKQTLLEYAENKFNFCEVKESGIGYCIIKTISEYLEGNL